MEKNEKIEVTHCGYIAILGKPNVGKSTLLNHLIGQKISITSRKPQTTRHQILGINTIDGRQMIFIDTPGIHKSSGKVLNKVMNKNATSIINGVNVILFVIEALHWREEDQWVLNKLETVECPVVLVINKTDQIKDKKELLPFAEELNKKFNFADIVMLSAKVADQVKDLEKMLVKFIPVGKAIYQSDEVTDRSMRFIAAEIVREKIIRLTGQELPYATAVEIEQYEIKDKVVHIAALILVDKPGQKTILIGTGGTKMKEIGKQARLELETILDMKVFLRLWVKVKNGWADDDRALRSLGYTS